MIVCVVGEVSFQTAAFGEEVSRGQYAEHCSVTSEPVK